jgi:CelD/BcsL family acetyltransferase involved in cellulose biosynthesis
VTAWQRRDVPLKYQLSDWTLFSIDLPLQMRAVQLTDEEPPAAHLAPPDEPLAEGSQGYSIRALPVASDPPRLSATGDFLCYVSLVYSHCYIDLRQSFEDYQKKFSSKTRSTINRKLKKYAEHSSGTTSWRTFRTPQEMEEFLGLARVVSAMTYQERLLGAGIPDSPAFLAEVQQLAAEDRVRAYILFDGQRPVSYLYCPVTDGVLLYAYLGYDPEYIKLSVGTVLQWLAVEQLFSEARFRFFDFTEGQSEHKRLFATHEVRCANVLFLRRSLRNRLLVNAHKWLGSFSAWLGGLLDRWGARAKVRRLLRFGTS